VERMGKERANCNYSFIIMPFAIKGGQFTDNVIFWCVRVTIVVVARQQCIPCLLLKYTSLTVIYK
jgi:hypothetical protein